MYESLSRCQKPEARLQRFCNCGAGLMVAVSTDGADLRLCASTCKDRWCVPCQTNRAAHFAEQLHRHVNGRNVRFLTLTLRHSPTSLSDQIDRLYRSFLAFRRRRVFKDHVKGGAGFLEIKISEKDGLWHVHLHCMVEGSFWDQKEISATWHGVTGDSSIVDVRVIKSTADAARYVTKYVTKPADASVYARPEKLDELVCSLGGRKLCMTFGTWRGFKLDPQEPPAGLWQTARSVTSLQAEARDGDANALRVLEAAHRKWPFLASIFPVPPAPEVDPP